jgi:hypothetical protein
LSPPVQANNCVARVNPATYPTRRRIKVLRRPPQSTCRQPHPSPLFTTTRLRALQVFSRRRSSGGTKPPRSRYTSRRRAPRIDDLRLFPACVSQPPAGLSPRLDEGGFPPHSPGQAKAEHRWIDCVEDPGPPWYYPAQKLTTYKSPARASRARLLDLNSMLHVDNRRGSITRIRSCHGGRHGQTTQRMGPRALPPFEACFVLPTRTSWP